MNDVLLTPIRLNELELLIQNSVEKAMKASHPKPEGRITPPDSLLTIDEASNFLHLSKATLYSKVSRGELPVMKRSGRLYFSSDELMAYVKAGRKKSNTEIEAEAASYVNKERG